MGECAGLPHAFSHKEAMDQKIDADKLPSVDDERPKFLKDPFGWYAQLSYRRPRTMFFSMWACIFLMCAIGAPFFKQTPNSDYDWR